MPTPPVGTTSPDHIVGDEGDPAQFVNGSGLTKAEQNALDQKTRDAATAQAIANQANQGLARMLQDQVFAQGYRQIRALRDCHSMLSDSNVNPTATPWQRVVYATLSAELNNVVTALEQMPVPQ